MQAQLWKPSFLLPLFILNSYVLAGPPSEKETPYHYGTSEETPKAHNVAKTSGLSSANFIRQQLNQLEENEKFLPTDGLNKPNLLDILEKKTTANYYLSTYEKDKELSAARLDEAQANVDRILTIDSHNSIAKFWAATIKAELAAKLKKDAGGNVKKLLAINKQLKEAEKELVSLSDDPKLSDYRHGGIYRVLGKIYSVAPKGISIGDSKKAEALLIKAKTNYGDFPENKLFYAEHLMKEQSEESVKEAVKIANEILSDPNLNNYKIEKDLWVSKSNVILEKAKELAEEASPQP